MAAYPVMSTGSFPRILWTLLLLAASLNAHNQKWDNPVCMEPLEVSAPRGSRVLMACNISNTFRDVTIELTANGTTTTIFDQKPPGSYFNDLWQLYILGGHAQLVIMNAQDTHAGEYLWRLHGLQRKDEILTLNVTDLDTTDQEPESLQVNAEPPPSGSNKVIVVIFVITVIIIIVIIIVSVCACRRKRSRSLKYHRYEGPRPGLSHGFPGGLLGPHLTLPKVFRPEAKGTQGALLVPDSRLQGPLLARADNLYLNTPHIFGQAHRKSVSRLSPRPWNTLRTEWGLCSSGSSQDSREIF